MSTTTTTPKGFTVSQCRNMRGKALDVARRKRAEGNTADAAEYVSYARYWHYRARHNGAGADAAINAVDSRAGKHAAHCEAFRAAMLAKVKASMADAKASPLPSNAANGESTIMPDCMLSTVSA